MYFLEVCMLLPFGENCFNLFIYNYETQNKWCMTQNIILHYLTLEHPRQAEAGQYLAFVTLTQNSLLSL